MHNAGSVIKSGMIDRNGSCRTLSPAQDATLAAVPADGTAHTVDLGRYRVAAQPVRDGVILTGLPLRGVRSTVYWLAAVVTVVALIGLMLAALAGAAVIRLTLRPLRRVAATAGRVAELPLDRGEVALAVRVPQADTDPRTEVGQVGAALNRMLGHVADALSAPAGQRGTGAHVRHRRQPRAAHSPRPTPPGPTLTSTTPPPLAPLLSRPHRRGHLDTLRRSPHPPHRPAHTSPLQPGSA